MMLELEKSLSALRDAISIEIPRVTYYGGFSTDCTLLVSILHLSIKAIDWILPQCNPLDDDKAIRYRNKPPWVTSEVWSAHLSRQEIESEIDPEPVSKM